jgi:hypothetical protein
VIDILRNSTIRVRSHRFIKVLASHGANGRYDLFAAQAERGGAPQCRAGDIELVGVIERGLERREIVRRLAFSHLEQDTPLWCVVKRRRHCTVRSDEATQGPRRCPLDCFAAQTRNKRLSY